MENALGLVMTGGGARGAYPAGVLKRIGELPRVREFGNPFPIIGGSSAGAVNGCGVAVGCDEFSIVTKILAKMWGELRPSDIFRCDAFAQARNSITWILDLSFGAVLGGGNARSLLDATPMREFLRAHLDTSRIQDNIRRGYLYALAISATNYNSGKSYLFIQGMKGHAMWNRSRRVTLSTKITTDHICASAAIPLVFQPIKLRTAKGSAFFGDGCIRLQQPLSPIIRLGAERVFGIGVRGETRERVEEAESDSEPSLAQVMGVFFNVMFLDHLATDVEHLDRLNRLLREGQISQSGTNPVERMRPLATMLVTPSADLTEVARQHQKDMPYLIQYFVNGLGRDAVACADLMSYLLFTPKYTRALIDIGYTDATKRIDEIEEFLFSTTNGGGVSKSRMGMVAPKKADGSPRTIN